MMFRSDARASIRWPIMKWVELERRKEGTEENGNDGEQIHTW
jgi:hypothetical protein